MWTEESNHIQAAAAGAQKLQMTIRGRAKRGQIGAEKQIKWKRWWMMSSVYELFTCYRSHAFISSTSINQRNTTFRFRFVDRVTVGSWGPEKTLRDLDLIKSADLRHSVVRVWRQRTMNKNKKFLMAAPRMPSKRCMETALLCSKWQFVERQLDALKYML